VGQHRWKLLTADNPILCERQNGDSMFVFRQALRHAEICNLYCLALWGDQFCVFFDLAYFGSDFHDVAPVGYLFAVDKYNYSLLSK